MTWWQGRKVRQVDILPNAILSGQLGSGAVFRDAVPDDELYTDKLLEFHADVSNVSGGVTTSILPVAHNLGSARIYGATLLSFQSALGTTVEIGLVNASRIELRFSHATAVASGIIAHVFVMV